MKLFNLILKMKKKHDHWKVSIVVPLYKKGRDVQNCVNKMSIKLMRHHEILRKDNRKKKRPR